MMIVGIQDELTVNELYLSWLWKLTTTPAVRLRFFGQSILLDLLSILRLNDF